jgi:hypothetical protein
MHMDPEVEALLRKPTITVKEFLRVVPMGRNEAYGAIRRREIEVLPGRGKRKFILTAPLRRKLGLPEAAA